MSSIPDPSEHARDRGKIESIARQLPGFRGYFEKEYRRESDALQREWLSDRLERAKPQLDDFARSLVETGKLDIMPQCERLRGRLDKLAARIRGAMRGYSGFFDLVQIDEERLEDIYDFDNAMIDHVDEFAEKVEKLPQQQDEADARIRELLDETQRLEKIWNEREDILKGLD